MLLQNYRKIYNPGQVLVMDESMVPFRGRLHFRQYIPNKTHKYGVKLYKLCTANGYSYDLKVYAGKGDTTAELGHANSIVLKLLDSFNPKEGRYLFADNFYSSISLTEMLWEQKIIYCGTLRQNRKRVPETFPQNMKKNEVFGQQKNNVKVIKWMDKRHVLMVTSDPSHNDLLIPTGKKNRKGEEVMKPKCIIDYNKAKKGVDFSDQMASYHTVLRKSLKWYRKVMFEVLLRTTVVNVWIIYNIISNTKLSITQFRKQLLENLVTVPEITKKETVQKKKEFTLL